MCKHVYTYACNAHTHTLLHACTHKCRHIHTPNICMQAWNIKNFKVLFGRKYLITTHIIFKNFLYLKMCKEVLKLKEYVKICRKMWREALHQEKLSGWPSAPTRHPTKVHKNPSKDPVSFFYIRISYFPSIEWPQWKKLMIKWWTECKIYRALVWSYSEHTEKNAAVVVEITFMILLKLTLNSR